MEHDARLPVDSLKLYGRNPRTGDIEAIRESLRANGQYRPLVVRRKTSEVLAGNHTLKAAREEGWFEVWATFIDVDAKQAKRIVLVDNRTNDLAGYDGQALADLIGELPDLTGSCYDEDAVRALVASVAPDGDPPPDSAPAPPDDPQAKPGDLYQLGPHRLLCGDARSADALARLVGEDLAHAVWTDPPYGVSYRGKTKAALTIEGDGNEGLDGLLRDAFAAVDAVLKPGAAIYVAHPAGPLSVTFGIRFLEQGWRLRQTLVWVKDSMVLGHSDYHYEHEPILAGEKALEEDDDSPALGDEHAGIHFGYAQGAGRRGRGGAGWYGDNKQVSVHTVPRPKRNPDHPTMKPIELIEIGLRNSSVAGDVVLDPFGGAGSTLMACEHLGRRARLLELDPRYVDVIVRRWENHTGRKAERVDGP